MPHAECVFMHAHMHQASGSACMYANIAGLAAVLDSSLDFAFPKHVVPIEEGSWKIPGRS